VSRLEIAPRAEDQIRRIARWWREHRPASPSLFTDELAEALELLAANPIALAACNRAPSRRCAPRHRR